ncbi:MAG: 4Fe-4S dicluster domain-containing protein [Candidatus Bathyarchaeia archaeon]
MAISVSPEKCTNCRICELACSFKKHKEFNPSLSRIRVFNKYKEGLSVPILCKQCENPPCVDICPTRPLKAINKDENTGLIKVNKDICIGCKSCVLACPFGAISWHDAIKLPLICDFCDGDPQCVKYCPADVLHFVPLITLGQEKRLNYATKIKSF